MLRESFLSSGDVVAAVGKTYPELCPETRKATMPTSIRVRSTEPNRRLVIAAVRSHNPLVPGSNPGGPTEEAPAQGAFLLLGSTAAGIG